MRSSGGLARRILCAVVVSLLFNLPANCGNPKEPSSAPCVNETQRRLEAGDVIVSCEDISGIKYVVGKILVDQTPEKLWPILVNPYEFEGKICHRMKDVRVITDEPNTSLLACTVAVVFPLPDLKYEVESHYRACSRIDFQRISGSLRDFRGFWSLAPAGNGGKTEVTYSMYLDPGFPVPDWLVRQGVKCELPSVLTGLRERVNELKKDAVPVKHTIAAAIVSLPALAHNVNAAALVKH